jgi:hypothetical protein
MLRVVTTTATTKGEDNIVDTMTGTGVNDGTFRERFEGAIATIRGFCKGRYEGKTDESYENEKEASNAMFFFFRRPRVEDDDAF